LKDSSINIIVNFLNNKSNIEELEFLLNWIDNTENFKTFRQFISVHHLSNHVMNKANKEKIIQEINSRIRSQKQNKTKIGKMYFKLTKYAAIIILSIGLGFYINQDEIIVKQIEEVTPSKITLETSEGKQIVIEESTKKNIQIGEKLTAKKKPLTIAYEKNPEIDELKFNTINIPYGKRFNVELSDGSVVYLNSGTSMTFPIQFIKGKDREVHINGEAFFDVTHDDDNTFRVRSNDAIVEVYGTKFNFKNYPEDSFSEVTLTQGSIGLKSDLSDKEVVKIEPSFKAKLNKSRKDIEVTRVNTKMYTSWIEGRVVFRDENIDNLILKLERLYNVSITNNNKSLSNNFFNATIFIENETIEDVLKYLKKVYNIDYQVINNKIIIK
jgi:transmembrane sensor